MQEPDDFGLSPERTLAHVADPRPAADHSVFWTAWLQRLVEQDPVLEPRPADVVDPSDTTATHQFCSVHWVRIGCGLIEPPGGTPVRAGLVTTHGYAPNTPIAESLRAWRTLAERGVAVLALRVRGYPGSQLDCGDWTTPTDDGQTWITRGLDTPGHGVEPVLGWSLSLGTADLACGLRAMRRWLDERMLEAEEPMPRPPLWLHGESFGGGLATIVAAQLTGKRLAGAMIDRLVLSMPTFGDTAFRTGSAVRTHMTGAGREINELLDRAGDDRETIIERLRMFDAAVHAPRVRAHVLCELARRDEVVPAPTAAAVFNGLGASPGSKWRFVIPYGHVEGNVATLRRRALFRRCAHDFLDPGRLPREAMLVWEGILHEGERGPDGAVASIAEDRDTQDAAPAASLFGDEPLETGVTTSSEPDPAEAALIAAYERAGRTLDALPYTDVYETLHAEAGIGDKAHTLRLLQRFRKAGKLPKLGRAPDKPPAITPEEETLLCELVERQVGSLGKRDGLPYTPAFDAVFNAFAERTGRQLSPHDVWRLIAKLAK